MADLEAKDTARIVSALCAAALVPGLRSLLVFDARPSELRRIARTAVEILRAKGEGPVSLSSLGPSDTDDELWGSFMLRNKSGESPLFWQPGLLPADDGGSSTRVVLIPDLTQLSLMAARACVMLMGESVASLERYGRQKLWRPRIFWVAGCATAEVGKVSAHLLDRFALRLGRVRVLDRAARASEIKRLLTREGFREGEEPFPLPENLGATLRGAAAAPAPRLTDEAVAHVRNYITASAFYSPRRDLALARLAVAQARLGNAPAVAKAHVEQAAQITGLQPLAYDAAEPAAEEKESAEPRSETRDPSTDTHGPDAAAPAEEQRPPVSEPQLVREFARESDAPPEHFPAAALPAAPEARPYAEDEAAVEHEDSPLRLPPRVSRGDAGAGGAVIGTQRATSLHDLALVRTLIEAAKFRPVRRKHLKAAGDEWRISPTDLYSYRREPTPEDLLILLLDYTCLRDAAWEDALFPYLKEAYTKRAMICLIKVGAAHARHELKAERIEARSILVPEVAAAFEATPGRATPLAHGLDLALQTLRRTLQHGRGGPKRATFVMLSDGRGNVPLEDSRRGEIAPPVMRRGFDDALVVARQIRQLGYARAVFLSTQPQQHAEMPAELAEALGAEVREVPPAQSM